MKTESDKNVEKLEKLRVLLKKNINAYFRSIDDDKPMSFRMYTWIDDYDGLRHKPGWKEYCARHGSHVDHNSYDLFA